MTRTSKSVALALAGALVLSSCTSLQANNPTATPAATEWKVRSIQQGQASWYGVRCNGGTHTASGETLCDDSSTAAHKTLPMNTKVRVTNLANGKSEIVRINNRGPYIRGRIIDVTEGVAHRLGFHDRGITRVKVEVLEKESSGQAEG